MLDSMTTGYSVAARSSAYSSNDQGSPVFVALFLSGSITGLHAAAGPEPTLPYRSGYPVREGSETAFPSDLFAFPRAS